jgi:hypothetical protein
MSGKIVTTLFVIVFMVPIAFLTFWPPTACRIVAGYFRVIWSKP